MDNVRWSLDCHTTKGRKSENQDSLLMMTCLPYHWLDANSTVLSHPMPSTPAEYLPSQAPLLILIADGVSACQFPKQASRQVVDTTAHYITLALASLAKDAYTSEQQDMRGAAVGFDDDQIASVIGQAVNKANDRLYFPQVYQRVPPLLSTLSGLLCIGDRIHLFHTGDSRIYRVDMDGIQLLSKDHRIHSGQDKGALSAAIGADVHIDLQQSVFTLYQNECLVLMTDGVYEHIDAAELQFELCTAATAISQSQATQNQAADVLGISQTLCEHALQEGSQDNLSMILLSMTASNTHPKSKNTPQTRHTDQYNDDKSDEMTRYQLPTGLEVGAQIDGFTVVEVIARTARSDVYRVQDQDKQDFVLKSPSLDTIADGHYLREFLKERKIGLSLSKHRRAGEPVYNQPDPNQISARFSSDTRQGGTAHMTSGLLRYYPVPASSQYLYHLTEYVNGERLRDFIERNAPCDVWQTYDLLTKIGMAVRVMHRNYLLHQDIKPENILLTASGAVKLIDFGSASSLILKDNTRPPNGDLHYAAPEYYTDAPKGIHSDLFSMAVIGYELLTGQLPFGSQDLMNAQKPLIVPVPLLRQHRVAATSQQALLRALHSNTNARYQAIGEFLQDFNPDNSTNIGDPEPLIIRQPRLVWHSICFIQLIIILSLLVYIS